MISLRDRLVCVQKYMGGPPLSKLLDMAGVQPGAVMVKFYSGDGVYTDSLTLDQARMDDIMVAVMHDGKPIPNQLGGPVRLVTPQMYAYKSVKWLNRIELINEDYVGYWEQRGTIRMPGCRVRNGYNVSFCPLFRTKTSFPN